MGALDDLWSVLTARDPLLVGHVALSWVAIILFFGIAVTALLGAIR